MSRQMSMLELADTRASWSRDERSGAIMSGCETYRYRLWRGWQSGLQRTVLWVMLNPSTADATTNDPTVRKCIGFSKRWGFTALQICNLFALRSTSPKALKPHPDPVGPENHDFIYDAAEHRADAIVAAWGRHGHLFEQGYAIAGLLDRIGPVQCLGQTANGQPRHPLMLAYDTPLQTYDFLASPTS